MKIGVLTDRKVANSAYRAPVGLALRGHVVELDGDGERHEHPKLFGCDVVHIYRYNGPSTRRLARGLRERGIGVVWDVDDDVSGEPEHARDRWRPEGMNIQKMVRGSAEMARIAHVVTTTSEPLAERYRADGAASVNVVPNFVSEQFAAGAERAHDGVVVGWVGSSEHFHDLRQLGLEQTMRRLLDNHADVRVATVGVRMELSSDRYDYRMMVQYHDLGRHIARFDVGIAPIDDVPFNRARSDVKVKEYAAAGVPWLASPIGPYAGLGEKQGGRLVADDGWYEALDRLVTKQRERRKLAKRAASWAREQSLERNLHRWEAVMEEAAELARRG